MTQKAKLNWSILFPLILGTMLNPLNSTMLATALASICNQFARDVAAGSLLITPLYVAATVAQPLMGRLADLFNPKFVVKLGFSLVLLAALIGIFAQHFWWLVVSRIILGIGTSATYPSSMAILTSKYKNTGQVVPPRVLGVFAIGSQLSMVLGPVIGGFLTQFLGWQGVFIINIPWVLTAFWFLRNVPSVSRFTGTVRQRLQRIDLWGVALMAAWLICLFCLLSFNINRLFSSVGLIVFLGLFVWWEMHRSKPFINIRLLIDHPSLLLVYFRTLATNYILYLLLYALPQWVEGVRGMTPGQTGLITFPMSAMSALAAVFISRQTNLFKINLYGLISLFVACGTMFFIQETVPLVFLVGIIILCGGAVGTNMIANQTSLSVEASSEIAGVSFGLYRTFGYLGAILSGSQIKTVFRNGVTDQSMERLVTYASISCIVLAVIYSFSAVRDRKYHSSLA